MTKDIEDCHGYYEEGVNRVTFIKTAVMARIRIVILRLLPDGESSVIIDVHEKDILKGRAESRKKENEGHDVNVWGIRKRNGEENR